MALRLSTGKYIYSQLPLRKRLVLSLWCKQFFYITCISFFLLPWFHIIFLILSVYVFISIFSYFSSSSQFFIINFVVKTCQIIPQTVITITARDCHSVLILYNPKNTKFHERGSSASEVMLGGLIAIWIALSQACPNPLPPEGGWITAPKVIPGTH